MIRSLLGDTATGRGITLIWGHRRQWGLEIVPKYHAWFIGIDKRP